MTPLSDRDVIIALIATLGVVFALVFWTVRLTPRTEPPLLPREGAPEARLVPGAVRSAPSLPL